MCLCMYTHKYLEEVIDIARSKSQAETQNIHAHTHISIYVSMYVCIHVCIHTQVPGGGNWYRPLKIPSWDSGSNGYVLYAIIYKTTPRAHTSTCNMYVCMYIFKCIYICIYVCMYVCMYYKPSCTRPLPEPIHQPAICMYVCMYVCMYDNNAQSPYIDLQYVCMYIFMYVCMYVCMHYTSSCTNFELAYRYMHTKIRAHKQMLIPYKYVCMYVCFIVTMYQLRTGI
jgi:hypothetical protein